MTSGLEEAGHREPQTSEEIEVFRRRWGDDPEGFARRWSPNRFKNPNIARDLSPAERAQRDREKALLAGYSAPAEAKPKARRTRAKRQKA